MCCTVLEVGNPHVTLVPHSGLPHTHARTHKHTLLFIHSLTLPPQNKILLPAGQQERCTAAKHYSNTVQYCEYRTVILGSLGYEANNTSHVVQRGKNVLR